MSGLHGCECIGIVCLLLIVDRAEITDRRVTTLAVLLTVYSEGELLDQLLGAVQVGLVRSHPGAPPPLVSSPAA